VTYDWNFGRLAVYREAFFLGTLNTVGLAVLVIAFGTLLGAAVGFGLRLHWVRVLLYPLIDIVRAIPPLVLILFCYYFFTEQVVGLAVPGFWVAVVALSVNLAAFVADIIRSALDEVRAEDVEAGLAVGMNAWQVRRYIIIPSVIRYAAPAITVMYIGMLKLTSLASVVNVREVVYSAQTIITDSARSLEVWVIVAGIYILLVLPSTYAARWFERALGRGRRENRVF